MNILHISQGLPPFRRGGLTTYCLDLMTEQRKQGHEVSILYPGHYDAGDVDIRVTKQSQFSVYELINPLPLALTFGIKNPNAFTKECKSKIYQDFFKRYRFDVVHVHSTMGFHKELFEEIKNSRIPMVFTTHDYYLLCPKCTFIMSNGCLCEGASPEKCRLCNAGSGISERKNRLLQSVLYQRFKQSGFLSIVRSIARRRASSKRCITESEYSASDFEGLLDYNIEILRLMNVIHCNSPLTERIYRRFEPNLNYVSLPITHNGLPEKIKQNIVNTCFHIVNLNGTSEAKGYSQIERAVEKLGKYGVSDWRLDVYGSISRKIRENEKIHIYGRFTQSDLSRILRDADCVVCASMWYETFGFVVQEALAAGVPVVVSSHTGSQCLTETAPISLVYDVDRDEALTERLVELKQNLPAVKKWAQNLETITLESHVREVERLYNRVMESVNDK